MLGFSLGQVSALAVSGMLSDEATFALVKARSELMAEAAAAHPGVMSALLKADEDGVAARREIRRKQIARCVKIGDKVLRALDRKAAAAAKDTRTINDGLAVLEKAAKDGVIALSEAEVASLRNVVSDYTGVGLRELAGTMKDVAARQETLEQHLGEKDSTGVQITFVEGAEELAE